MVEKPQKAKVIPPKYETLSSEDLVKEYRNGIICEYTLNLQAKQNLPREETQKLFHKLAEVHAFVQQLQLILIARLS